MNKNQNRRYIKKTVKYTLTTEIIISINWKVYATQMKSAGIPTPTILKTILIIFKLCMILYEIIQF